VIKKKAIVCLISDFMSKEYENTLKIASKKHDVTGIRIFDRREETIPNIGIVNLLDSETGETILVDTNSKNVRLNYEKHYKEHLNYFSTVFSKCGAGTINARVDESYVTKLLGYFKARN
jgi:hypothetical protein